MNQEKILKLEKTVQKRKEKIQKYTELLKKEKAQLKNDETFLNNAKYAEVLKKIQEKGLDTQEALQAIENIQVPDQRGDSNNGF
ncbi:MAG TPA: hypothetical protein DCF99_07930 [Flavobacteriaceae bacterium]|nr:hypothetical protein [Flavobacteriaceae bacterium]